MPRFIAQARLIKLPNPAAEPDEWSSATSTMTVFEVSVPFDASTDALAVLRTAEILYRTIINHPAADGPRSGEDDGGW